MVSAENVHGATFGKIAEAMATDKVHKGIRLPPDERFKSSHMEFYQDPKQVKMPIYNVVEEKVAVESKKPATIPPEAVNQFWGVQDKTQSYNKSLEEFFS